MRTPFPLLLLSVSALSLALAGCGESEAQNARKAEPAQSVQAAAGQDDLEARGGSDPKGEGEKEIFPNSATPPALAQVPKSNDFWWPDQVDLTPLRQNEATRSNPMGEDFDYAEAF
ncbi:MAG: hypothetical protein V2I43_17990, partial [Parvularcula sp.]|nr:hypothetical protein [Parvularcula sp.]